MIFDYDQLDPGIRRVVRWLHAHDFDTCDSGDGVSKKGTDGEGCMHDVPNVLITVEPANLVSECDRLHELLAALVAVEPCSDDPGAIWVQGNYDPTGPAFIMLIGLHDRALPDDVPWEAGVDENGTPEAEASHG